MRCLKATNRYRLLQLTPPREGANQWQPQSIQCGCASTPAPPRGGRTATYAIVKIHAQATTHAPAWGANTQRTAESIHSIASTHAPVWGRTSHAEQRGISLDATTHAPRAWANLMRRKTAPSGRILQLTPPVGGRTIPIKLYGLILFGYNSRPVRANAHGCM